MSREALRVLFVDMDETLIHSSDRRSRGAYEVYASGDVYWTVVRPEAEEALGLARELFDEVYLFTAAKQDYADAVLDATGLRAYFDAVYTADTPKKRLPDVSGVRWVLIDDSAWISEWKLTSLGLRPSQFSAHWQPIRAYRGGRSDDHALPEAVLLAFQQTERL
jgi:FMN phosphatase YigB (HAD superfamily)